jgi:small conductance mechanosensitive channel
MVTPDDTVVTIPHLAIWTTSIHNANDGQRDLQCVADFYLHPDHDAVLVRQKLREVALTSPFIQLERPVSVVVAETPWATHYRLKAYPIEGRDQFQFTSDLTVRGKQALGELEVKAAAWAPIPGAMPGG